MFVCIVHSLLIHFSNTGCSTERSAYFRSLTTSNTFFAGLPFPHCFVACWMLCDTTSDVQLFISNCCFFSVLFGLLWVHADARLSKFPCFYGNINCATDNHAILWNMFHVACSFGHCDMSCHFYRKKQCWFERTTSFVFTTQCHNITDDINIPCNLNNLSQFPIASNWSHIFYSFQWHFNAFMKIMHKIN